MRILFLGYTFINIQIKPYTLYDWDKEVSDLVAQIIEI